MPDVLPLLLIELWRAADRRARELENAIFTQAVNSMKDLDRAPTDAQWAHARQAREEAKELFQKAMAAVGEARVDSGRSRLSGPRTGDGAASNEPR